MPERRLRLGWWLSSEEHDPRRLVATAQLAETSGFPTAMISDHLHPWVRAQGHSSHMWTTVGAIAHATDAMEIGTGVTAMVHRSHPVNVAQAAATVAILLEGRFFLGVGTGERLNEQAFGERWPSAGERRQWLADGIEVLRQAFTGDPVTIDDGRWRVDGFQLFDLPASPPPIRVAASGAKAAKLAGELGDGLIAVTPDSKVVDAYHGAGGDGPTIGQVHISLAGTLDAARETAWRWWPNGAIAGPVLSELARPSQFEAASKDLRRDAIDQTVVCATGPEPVVHAIDKFVAAGFDTIYLHQIGPDQERLADLARRELLPHYQ
jgi:coenzyme F420-dependent glucose-6-phosphate dehydrogenase